VRGNTGCVPDRRSWQLTFLAHQAADVTVTVDGAPVAAQDAPVQVTGRRTSVRVEDVPVTATIRVSLGERPQLAVNDVEDRLFALLHRAQLEYSVKTRAHQAATADAPLPIRLAQLQALDLGRPLETALFELLLARPDPG
jgi:hypothetical protein